ncbi:HlyD family secretion protein [Vibrio coralliilyticus]|uniref:HlyD family secretion protein n=1 Tax=Vibrio coralliilyticus TaxID=190893 RepID=UPI0018131625|nr:HlyD family efflux transporter periplasmic adaptor subunit [Vibrio coralliilyticus]NUW70136.1 HlyD family efflux transporter periplasmic adaptor subunit [Vibrio coralliilyticus]
MKSKLLIIKENLFSEKRKILIRKLFFILKKNWVSYSSFGLLIVLITIALLSEIEVVSNGQGVIKSDSSDISIMAPESGIITSVKVSTGQAVSKNDVLFEFRNIEDHNALELNEKIVKSYKEKIEILAYESEKINSLNSDSSVDGEVYKLTPRLKLILGYYNSYIYEEEKLEGILNRYLDTKDSIQNQIALLDKKSRLLKRTVGESLKYIDVELEVEKLSQSLIQNEEAYATASDVVHVAKDLFQQESYRALDNIKSEMFESKESIASSSQEVKRLNEKIEQSSIKAPSDSTVLSLIDGLSEGTYIERNSEIMSLKRERQSIYVMAKFDSRYRPYLLKNNPVKIQIDSPGLKDVIIGKISDISVDSFEYEEQDKIGERYYAVEIEADSYYSDNIELVGVNVDTYAINSNIKMYEFIFSYFKPNMNFSVW